jgi:hypothetical protein
MLFGKDLRELKNGRALVIRVPPLILSPTGKDYSNRGVKPDLSVKDNRTPDHDPILQRAIAEAAHVDG